MWLAHAGHLLLGAIVLGDEPPSYIPASTCSAWIAMPVATVVSSATTNRSGFTRSPASPSSSWARRTPDACSNNASPQDDLNLEAGGVDASYA